jgi:hypothetical protein
MQATKKQTAEQIDAREAPREDRLEAHDALIRDVAEDARTEPERYLKETIVPEGGE